MYSIGVDIGGTFTDVFLLDEDSGAWWISKVPSTPPDFGQGFLRGIDEVAQAAGIESDVVRRLVHGTTVGTNAILEHKGARLGMITTLGFEDVLVIGKANRREMYDLMMDADEPLFLAPRRRVRGVCERITPDGEVIRPLSPESVVEAVRSLVDEHDIEALVICFLHSYADPSHEQLAKELVRQNWPDLPVSVSSEIDPNFRESERLLVTCFDAYVRPRVVEYLSDLQSDLASEGWHAPLQVMQSHGGIAGVASSLERPVATVLSGPAAGVVGAAHAAMQSGLGDCLTFDMGGTSTDVALVQRGRPIVATTSEIDGYPLRVPMVDVRTIGAGGGSIAWLDRAGGLRVGPRSAGSRPGPACYGLGAVDPTVTDASVLLGYLNPTGFAGGLTLDRSLAESSIVDGVGKTLSLAALDAALGIHAIINSRMAQALRMVSIERGADPRELALIAFGGAGPVHAVPVAAEIGIGKVIVPPTPGVYCAMGLLGSPIEHGFSRTFRRAAQLVDLDELNDMLGVLDAECERRMSLDDVQPDDGVRSHFAEMRYVGQSHELEVAIETPMTRDRVESAVELFHERHRRIYAYAKDDEPVEFVALRAVRTKHVAGIDLNGSIDSKESSPTPIPSSTRDAYFDLGGERVATPVYRRTDLPNGSRLVGPAIVEQLDTTTIIYPGCTATVDEIGNVVIHVGTTQP